MSPDGAQVTTPVRNSNINWRAVGLELIPQLSLATFLVALIFESATAFWMSWAPLLAAGAGWWRIGRPVRAFALALVRGIAVVGLALATLYFVLIEALSCDWEGPPSDCDSEWAGAPAFAFFICFVVVAFLIPIASAVMVARASRIR